MTTQSHFKNMCVRSINLNMEDICTGCLCSGRKLYSIKETGFYQLYEQILNEIPVQDMSQLCIQVCWECRYLLRKFQHFKDQVKRNYAELLWNIPSPSQPRLIAGQVFNITYPEMPNKDESLVKEESVNCDDIKTESIDMESTEHREPETFVNDYGVDQKENKPTKKTKKKPKEKKPSKSKIKIKVKKKKKKVKETPEPVEANSEKELELDDDFQNDDGTETEREESENSKIHIAVEITKVESLSLEEDKSSNRVPVLPLRKNVELLPEKPQCVECGKMFSSRKTYRYHLNVLHKGNNRYPCPRCGKIYQWKSNLGRHMRTHKAVDAGELYCSLCDKSFASVATYRQHLRISRRHVSENEFSFTCNECGKKFVNKTRLRDHIDWEHLKKIKFRCQLCNKPFKCHTSLYVHLQNVHRNKEKKDNLCHVCGKSYQNAAKLKYHIIALHTGETPYQCSQCAAAFGWYSSLYRHIREVHYKVKNQPKKSKKSKVMNEPPGYMNYQ